MDIVVVAVGPSVKCEIFFKDAILTIIHQICLSDLKTQLFKAITRVPPVKVRICSSPDSMPPCHLRQRLFLVGVLINPAFPCD